jgi:hypothetical protein
MRPLERRSDAREERRAALRYRGAGVAALRWKEHDTARTAVLDVSALGCQLAGEHVPNVGESVSICLDLQGVPGLELPAQAVRCGRHARDFLVGLEFQLRASAKRALARLLSLSLSAQRSPTFVMVSEPDETVRTTVVEAVRSLGARVLAVSNSVDAARAAQHFAIAALLVGTDEHGLLALATFAAELPHVFRVAYGRDSETERTLRLGYAHARALPSAFLLPTTTSTPVS